MIPYSIVRMMSLNGKTATAGTAIRAIIPPCEKAFSALFTFSYTPGATTHAGIVKYAVGVGQLALALAGATSLTLLTQPFYSAFPGNVNNPGTQYRAVVNTDVLVVKRALGGTTVNTVLSGQIFEYDIIPLTGGSGLTFTVGALPAAIQQGSTYWLMSASADIIPGRNTIPDAYALTTGARRSWPVVVTNPSAFVGCTPFMNQPIMFESNNITNAGTLDEFSGGHISFAQGRGQNK